MSDITGRQETRNKPTSSKARASLWNYHHALLVAYGARHWWPAETSFEVIVGAFLTQATNWRNVELSIANLRNQGLLTVQAISGIAEAELREVIRPSGFMVRKAAALKSFVAFLEGRYGGSLEQLAETPTDKLRAELLNLPAVGPETADAILLYALGHPVMVVDEYLRRVAVRHGLAPEGVPYPALQRIAEEDFLAMPAEDKVRVFGDFHALIVEVGKKHCKRVAHCSGCPLAPYLPPIQAQE